MDGGRADVLTKRMEITMQRNVLHIKLKPLKTHKQIQLAKWMDDTNEAKPEGQRQTGEICE